MTNPNYRRTFRELISSIKTPLDRQGFPSKDDRFSEKQIYDTILDMRTSFIKRTKTQWRGIGHENVQTIPCIKMEELDTATSVCPCAAPSGCKWLRSTKPIPKSIEIFSITNVNANFQADFVEWSQFKNKIYSRSNRPYKRYFTILDTGDGPYLYLYNEDFMDTVSANGLWENPNHAAVYTGCAEETERQKFLRCNPLDTPLYMDGDITDVVYKMTMSFLGGTTAASKVDIKSDSLDNAGGVENPTV